MNEQSAIEGLTPQETLDIRRQQSVKLRFRVISKTVYAHGMSVLLRPVDAAYSPENTDAYSDGVHRPSGSLELCNVKDCIGDRLEPGCEYELTLSPVPPVPILRKTGPTY